MKRIATILSISVFVLLMSAGGAFALEGAEPPPEGMLGITAVQEEPVEERPGDVQPGIPGGDTPVSDTDEAMMDKSGPAQTDSSAGEQENGEIYTLKGTTRGLDPENIAENERNLESEQAVVDLADTVSTAAKSDTANPFSGSALYAVAGALVIGAGLYRLKRSKKSH